MVTSAQNVKKTTESSSSELPQENNEIERVVMFNAVRVGLFVC